MHMQTSRTFRKRSHPASMGTAYAQKALALAVDMTQLDLGPLEAVRPTASGPKWWIFRCKAKGHEFSHEGAPVRLMAREGRPRPCHLCEAEKPTAESWCLDHIRANPGAKTREMAALLPAELTWASGAFATVSSSVQRLRTSGLVRREKTSWFPKGAPKP